MVSYQNNANAGRAKSSASHAGPINYQGSSVQKYFTIDKTTLQITWNNPQAIDYGTALSSTQLNAEEANVLGSFAYNPLAGTVLLSGTRAEGNLHAHRDGELQQRQCAGPDRCQPLFIHQLRPADRHGRRLQHSEARKHDPGEVQSRWPQDPLQTTQKPLCRGEA
jgi:hypothetical protein